MALQISVITAVFNRADTLGDALASLRAQTWPHVEHIVVDAASTDGSQHILARHRNSMAKLVSEPDDGLYDGLNKGIGLATGDVVGFLHADDMYASPDTLQSVARAFQDPKVDAVYGDVVYVDKRDPSRVVRYWRAGEFRPELLRSGWMPPHTTLYLRRSVYERFGGFDTRYCIAADYDHVLRVLGSGRVNVAYVPDVLMRMRLGGASNSSVAGLVRKAVEDYNAMRQNHVGGVQALIMKNLSKLPQFFRESPELPKIEFARTGSSRG